MGMEQTSTFKSAGAAAAALVRAWADEIVQLARERFPGASRDVPDRLEILVEEEGLVLNRQDQKGAMQFAQIRYGTDAHAGLSREAAELGNGSRRDATLRISESLVLTPTLSLPWSSKRTLKAALSFELERLTPIEPKDVYFDFLVLGREPETNRANLRLRMVRRSVIDNALKLCHGASLKIARIVFEGETKEADIQSFPVDRPAWLRAQWRRFGEFFLAGLVALLLIAIAIAGYERGAAANDALAASVDEAMVRAAAVERMEHRMETANRAISRLVALRQGPLLVGDLAALSRILPDGTWLSELHLEDGKFRLDGYSKNASALIAVIDRSDVFTNAQFSAPLVRNPNDGTDRFELTFERAGARPRS